MGVTKNKVDKRLAFIKKNKQIGDFALAAEIIGISTENVRNRLLRGKEDVLEAMEKVIESRKEFKKQLTQK
jgi:DNA-directed RNA polymerase specialized sigma24 family protein